MTEPMWDAAVLVGVAQVLGDTEHGFTGPEIEALLRLLNIPDPGRITKWKRLEAALAARQAHDKSPKRVITFITEAMKPVRYRDKPEEFTRRQDGLNEVLSFVGLRVTEQGQLARGTVATTLDEASKNAATLRAELRRRRTHPEVLAYCTVELLKKSHFHAALEGTKGVFDRLRKMSGQSGDGAKLVDAVLALGSTGTPVIAINSGSTATDRDEQTGFANLLKGLNSMYRNPTAHDPRALRTFPDDDLLELLTMLSMIHRRLDSATVTP
ncbi:TIGR02391 family protein [Nocardia sp. NPDC059239]|uniref:TIGR02391 family protein n=1 Tax=Actinomycetes TaxID=1760 RepID=UPI003679DE2A